MSKRDEYVAKAHAKLDEQAARLDTLEARLKGEIATQKIEAHEQIGKLKEKLETSKAHLAELTETAEDTWEDVSKRFEVLSDDLGVSFKKFFSKHE